MRELLMKLIERYGYGVSITHEINTFEKTQTIKEDWTIAIPDKEIDYRWDFYEYHYESDMIAGANHLIAKPRRDGSK